MEDARRTSLAEEAAHQMRAGELAVRASSSRTMEIAGGNNDGVVVAEDTTKGVRLQRTWVPGNRTHQLAD